MTGTRVLLVDDQAMIRSGIRGLLELAEDVVVVGEAADGRHAVSTTRALTPDVVLMDLQMPGVDGVQAIPAIRADETIAATPVLVLTIFDQDDNVLTALQAGATGFLGRSAGHEEFVAAVRANILTVSCRCLPQRPPPWSPTSRRPPHGQPPATGRRPRSWAGSRG